MMMTFLTRVTALVAAAGLCACSSTHSDSDSKSKSDSASSGSSSGSASRSDSHSKEDPNIGKRLAQRLSIKEWNTKHRSQFEKQAQEAEKNKSVKTGIFHTGGDYHTKTASSAMTDKKYHGKEFAQSDKKNGSFEKSFQGSGEKNHMASESYKTAESHFGDKKSHENGREFSGGSEVFKTKSDVQAANAGAKAKEPKIIENRKPGYTEEEVRAMLNKG